jgi:hypothetical protein
LGTARPTVTKRQREQIKRDKRLLKAEKKAQRKAESASHKAAVGDESGQPR